MRKLVPVLGGRVFPALSPEQPPSSGVALPLQPAAGFGSVGSCACASTGRPGAVLGEGGQPELPLPS